MYTFKTQIRVRYAETDRMGYVYYGNYATYYEVARVEMLRNIGVEYRKLEDDGIMLPVLKYEIKYIKPAYYDELLEIKVSMKELPQSRITFEYEMFNGTGTLLNIGSCTLVFYSIEQKKAIAAPDTVLKKLEKYF